MRHYFRICSSLALLVCLVSSCATLKSPKLGLLDRAIERAGGETALMHASRLIWSGDADVHTPERNVLLSVNSDIVPFGHVRSESWLRDKGRSTMRVMELDAETGWVTRNGTRETLPTKLAQNEYLQYGTYDLIRLATLKDHGVVTEEIGKDSHGLSGLKVKHPKLGDSILWFDHDARLLALTNVVPSPDGKEAMQQRFEFKGSIWSNGVCWPREVRILQDGKLFFELRIASFKAISK